MRGFVILVLIFMGPSAMGEGTAGPCPAPYQAADKVVNAEDSSSMTPGPEHKHTNRLIHATSPYLLQHAHNPVNWFEWGDEALAKAKSEDKPIFLSIGYSACHWCHVMEHESFEDEEVAAVLNEHFVSIKVDREERPDLDDLYMAYTQALTRSGGWPMSIWATPDGTPFFAGTYFPKEHLLGLLGDIAQAWKNDRDRVLQGSSGARDFFERWSAVGTPAKDMIRREVVDKTATTLVSHFDMARGGIAGGGSNKFPPSMAMDLMLRVYHRTGNRALYEAVEVTLDHMARGGIYDQIGGGICRYSTDADWLVPHFEKMLYDQALVSGIFLDAFLVTHEPLYAKRARDLFDYVLTDLRSPEGAFYSSRDADSEGFEGKYYIWTVAQVHEVLGEEDGKLFCSYFDVSEAGNWFERMGHAPAGPKNILHVAKPPAAFAQARGIDTRDLVRRLEASREKMRAARSKRIPPRLDDKVLTAWNGLMIASLAKGARVLDDPKYAAAATRAADFILDKMRKDGRLLRSYRKGTARLTAYLSDYAFLTEGLLNLYEATFDRKWLDEALTLTETSIRYYRDPNGGAFFFTASDGEKLISRSKNRLDGAIPSGNSVQMMNLLRLATLLDRKDFRTMVESIGRALAPDVDQYAGSFERFLCAVDFYHDRVKEIAIIGDPDSDKTQALVRAVFNRYLPNKVVVHAAKPEGADTIPLLKNKTLRNGEPTAYVCEHYTCQRPVTTPEALIQQLEARPTAP